LDGARAQRAFMTTKLIKEAISCINLKQEVFGLPLDNDEIAFDQWHRRRCNELITVLGKMKK
jgi:hypothetical protein